MMIDGGIIRPKVPAPASEPTEMASGYPRRRSSGSVILPMVAQVAALEPVGEGRVQARLSDAGGTTLAVARRQTRALRTALGLR